MTGRIRDALETDPFQEPVCLPLVALQVVLHTQSLLRGSISPGVPLVVLSDMQIQSVDRVSRRGLPRQRDAIY